MLIGNTWIENARLRILNGFQAIAATPVWATFGQTLVLNQDEEGIIVGFQQLVSASAGGVLEMQILFNDTACHEGYFRSNTDNVAGSGVTVGNRQPTQMAMPFLDVPPGTEIGLRARFLPGVGVNLYLDLYVVAFHRAEQEFLAPICFPSDQKPMPAV